MKSSSVDETTLTHKSQKYIWDYAASLLSAIIQYISPQGSYKSLKMLYSALDVISFLNLKPKIYLLLLISPNLIPHMKNSDC